MQKAYPNSFEIYATDVQSLSNAFDERALSLGYLRTRNRRHAENSGLEEELYVLRRYIFTLAHEGLLEFPFNLRKHESPDFIITQAGLEYGLEVTTATSPLDQREWTKQEEAGRDVARMGDQGGRYYGDKRGNEAELDVVQDVLDAVEKKASLIRKGGYISTETTNLLVYVDSNAARIASIPVAFGGAEELDELLESSLQNSIESLTINTNIDKIIMVFDPRLLIFSDSVLTKYSLETNL